MSRQLWVVLACLLMLNVVQAQDTLPSLVVYMVEEPDESPFRHNFDLYAMNVDTDEIVFEARTADYECARGLSPDHRWLLYDVWTPDGTNPADTYLVDLQTDSSIFIERMGVYQWSPDSTQLVFARTNDDRQEIYIFDSQSREISQDGVLSNRSRPQFAWTDLGWVYAQKIGENALDVGGARQINQTFEENLDSFVLSPDGEAVALLLGEDEALHLFILNVETGDMQAVNDEPIIGFLPVWSPDGRWLVYNTRQGVNLWDNQQHTTFMTITDGFENIDSHAGGFFWSPDSRYLAYQHLIPGGTDLPYLILQLVDIETGDVRDIRSRVDIYTGSFSWVSSTQLAYTFADAGSSSIDIYLYDVATEESVNLTNSSAVETFHWALG